jgi:hypothetical protein
MKSNTNPKVPYQMERVRALIIKLQEQADQGAEPSVLLVTAQLLQAAIQEQASAAAVHRNGSSKVAVVLPAVTNSVQKRVVEPAPVISETAVDASSKVSEPETALPSDWLHNLMKEIPTLAHQKEIRELNDVMSQQINGASLNDKLKQGSVEVADVLTREPVRDLKKAIGVNDRFVFVQELFRGDEVMYERSIKTINSFNILQEAEYWIERELKLKLAWDDSKDTVRHFCQLVSRRFSSK